MAITTLAGILAGLRPREPFIKTGATMEAAGVLHSLLYTAGKPAAASVPSPGVSGAALTTYAGQIPFTNPASGSSYLARFAAASTSPGCLLLCDRLWHNSGLSTTAGGNQAVNSVTWPARDRLGDTFGNGVFVGLEVSSALGNAGPSTSISISYTDKDGAVGNTGTIPSLPATPVAGTFVPFTLAAGDTGVRSVQTLNIGGTSLVSGAYHLVAYRVLAIAMCGRRRKSERADAIRIGFPRLYNNTVPFLLWLPTSTTAATISGEVVYAQG